MIAGVPEGFVLEFSQDTLCVRGQAELLNAVARQKTAGLASLVDLS